MWTRPRGIFLLLEFSDRKKRELFYCNQFLIALDPLAIARHLQCNGMEPHRPRDRTKRSYSTWQISSVFSHKYRRDNFKISSSILTRTK